MCPDCDGKKTVDVLANVGPGGCVVMQMPCSSCHGAGELAAEPADLEAARAEGKRLRRERIERGETLMEAAQRLGMGLVEYSRRERGLLPEVAR